MSRRSSELATRRIMASVDPDYDVQELMDAAKTPAGRAARTSASGQMLTLTELQTRLEFAALLETRRRMEKEPLDDKFMPGLADRFVAENPCPTSYRGARPKRTSTTIKTQFALAGEANLDPIENDGLSIQLKLDAIEAQAPKALLATPQRSPTAVGVLAQSLEAGSDHLRLSEPLPRHETMEGWANASVVIGSGEGAELHRIRSVDASGTGAPPTCPQLPATLTTLTPLPPPHGAAPPSLHPPPSHCSHPPPQCCALAGRPSVRTPHSLGPAGSSHSRRARPARAASPPPPPPRRTARSLRGAALPATTPSPSPNPNTDPEPEPEPQPEPEPEL